MNDTAPPDDLDQAIDDMFEAFSSSTAIRQGRTMDFQVWSDRYSPLSHCGRLELNPRNPAHRRFLNNMHPRHIWAIQPCQEQLDGREAGRRARKETFIVPGSMRRGEPKLCVTLVPWVHDDQGLIITVPTGTRPDSNRA